MADMKNEATIEVVEAKDNNDDRVAESNGLSFDKYIAETVRRYPVLYDKSCKDFHERDVKDNAWQEVAQQTGLTSGQEAEKQFRLLRDRYQRAKMAIQRREVSGKSQVAIVRVQARLHNMNYLNWLDEHIKPRVRLNGVRSSQKSVMEEGDTENHVEILDVNECTTEFDSEMEFPSSSVPNTMVPARRKLAPCILPHPKIPKKTMQPRFPGGSKQQLLPDDDAKHSHYETRENAALMRDPEEERHIIAPDIHSNITVLRDSAQIFGDFVADQLRHLTRDQAVEARYKISGIFYSLMQNSQASKN